MAIQDININQIQSNTGSAQDQEQLTAALRIRQKTSEHGKWLASHRTYKTGTNHHSTKYSDELVRQVRAYLAASKRIKGCPHALISELLGLAPSIVCNFRDPARRPLIKVTVADVNKAEEHITRILAQASQYEQASKVAIRDEAKADKIRKLRAEGKPIFVKQSGEEVESISIYEHESYSTEAADVQTKPSCGNTDLDDMITTLSNSSGTTITTYNDFMAALLSAERKQGRMQDARRLNPVALKLLPR